MRTFLSSVLVCMASLSLAATSMAASITMVLPPSGYNEIVLSAINNGDAIAGYLVNSTTGNKQACYINSSGTITTLSLLSGGTESIGYAISDSNQVVGYGNTTVSVPSGSGTYRPAAFSWTSAGGVVDLNIGDTASANGINNAGTITGVRRPAGVSPATLRRGFALTSSSVVSDAPTPSDSLTFGFDINNASTPLLVGRCIPGTVMGGAPPPDEAWLWPLGGATVTYFSLGGGYGASYSVNDENYIVGTSKTAPDEINEIPGYFHAFLRNPSTGTLLDLHPSGSFATSTALGINENDIVVGYLSNDSLGYVIDTPPSVNAHRAFIWDATNGTRPLFNLVPSGSTGSTVTPKRSGWLSLEQARAINTGTGGSDTDKIVGFGQYYYYDSGTGVGSSARRAFIMSL